jgi:hypothetical protein
VNDTEMLNWLADRCYYPNDHPDDSIAVLVPDKFAPHGAFTCGNENDRAALRNAIEKAVLWMQ